MAGVPAERERVLLLHGIAAGPRSLRRLERALGDEGYDTVNPAIPTRRLPIEALAAWIAARNDPLFRPDSPLTHIVTSSMGGLVARVLIAAHRPPRLGRVMTIAPPHHGSEIADLLSGFALYHRMFGPVGSQLKTDPPPGLTDRLGRVDYPLGVIAGDRAVDPLAWLLIPGPSDGRVSVASTRLAGMADHATIHATHVAMMRNPRAIALTLHFLRHGRFSASHADTLDAAPGLC